MGATWTFHCAGQIVFGPGAIGQLGEVATRLGIQSAHLISDKILDKAGIVEKARLPLRQAGIEVLVDLGGEPEPTWAAAMACLGKARERKPDAIIGLGGGSNIANIAHLGGLLFGYLYLKFVPRRGLAFAFSEGYFSTRNSYHRWKRRRAARKFQVYMRNHGSDRDRRVH